MLYAQVGQALRVHDALDRALAELNELKGIEPATPATTKMSNMAGNAASNVAGAASNVAGVYLRSCAAAQAAEGMQACLLWHVSSVVAGCSISSSAATHGWEGARAALCAEFRCHQQPGQEQCVTCSTSVPSILASQPKCTAAAACCPAGRLGFGKKKGSGDMPEQCAVGEGGNATEPLETELTPAGPAAGGARRRAVAKA